VIDLTGHPPAVGRMLMRELRDRLGGDVPICVRGDGDGRGRLLTPAGRRLLTNGFAAMLAISIAGCTGDGPQVRRPSAAASRPGRVDHVPDVHRELSQAEGTVPSSGARAAAHRHECELPSPVDPAGDFLKSLEPKAPAAEWAVMGWVTPAATPAASGFDGIRVNDPSSEPETPARDG
jgi:hypothetical protein